MAKDDVRRPPEGKSRHSGAMRGWLILVSAVTAAGCKRNREDLSALRAELEERAQGVEHTQECGPAAAAELRQAAHDVSNPDRRKEGFCHLYCAFLTNGMGYTEIYVQAVRTNNFTIDRVEIVDSKGTVIESCRPTIGGKSDDTFQDLIWLGTYIAVVAPDIMDLNQGRPQ